MNVPPVQYATTTDGRSIAFTECGAGPPLVYLPHVINDVARIWTLPSFAAMFADMARHWRLIQFDFRGQGMSTRGLTDEVSLESYERDLAAVIDHLKVDGVVLFARGALGQAAVIYAAQQPQRVKALILHNYFDYSTGEPWGNLPERDWEMFLNTGVRFGFAGLDLEAANDMLSSATTQADYIKQRRVLIDCDVEPMLVALTVPTLLLTERSGTGGVNHQPIVRRVASLIPGAHVVFHDFATPKEWDAGPGALLREYLDNLEGPKLATARLSVAGSLLSARELEVLGLIVGGKSNQQIADDLVISLNTVQRHVSNILSKAGVANRTEAAVYAREHGLA